MQPERHFVQTMQWILMLVLVIVVLLAGGSGYLFLSRFDEPRVAALKTTLVQNKSARSEVWQAPDSTLILSAPDGALISYGRELIAHTALYLGPNGKVKAISNGMNCQNCHLKAGTKPFGNNYGGVASTYPKFRARSGAIETVEKRINDCLERSLNGQKLDENSREMRAIIAYFQWVGQNVEKGVVPKGAGIPELPFMERAADPAKGKLVFDQHCAICHGKDARGVRDPGNLEWRYPPLAGPDSYGVAAGLYRLSRFAGYVKLNMPHGTYYEQPVLTDEQAWDVAAFINSLPRPERKFAGDWPDISSKPYDHPFGPYADNFQESQHKYGPFAAIRAAKNQPK